MTDEASISVGGKTVNEMVKRLPYDSRIIVRGT